MSMPAISTAPTPRVMTHGRWLYCWNEPDWLKFEPTPAFLDTLETHDINRVIVHSVEPVPDACIEASEWCTPARVAAFNARGILVMIGVGFRAPPYWQQIAKAVIKAIDACKRANSPCVGLNVDWEGSWSGHKAEARLLIAAVLLVHPDAGLWITMPCWWAPEERMGADGKLHATQPSAPTKEWLELIDASIPIDPQCYGAPNEGMSKRMLAWARSQYLQHYGMPAWRVIASVQLYHRSLFDHLDLLLSEDTIALWDWLEADAVAKHALRIAKVLRTAGIVGHDWVHLFQISRSLKADGIAGPITLAALAAVCV
jgi:hypothetical protein